MAAEKPHRESERKRRYPWADQEIILVYQRHQLKPEDILDFIELHGFTDDWIGLKLNDDDLAALQAGLMSMPKGGKVIAGTGGLRKLRFAPERWKSGKSGAARVCYVYFEDHSLVLLVNAYPKTQKANLTAAERRIVKQLIARIHKQLLEKQLPR